MKIILTMQGERIHFQLKTDAGTKIGDEQIFPSEVDAHDAISALQEALTVVGQDLKLVWQSGGKQQ